MKEFSFYTGMYVYIVSSVSKFPKDKVATRHFVTILPVLGYYYNQNLHSYLILEHDYCKEEMVYSA